MNKLMKSIITFCIYILFPFLISSIFKNNNIVNYLYYLGILIFFIYFYKKDLLKDYKEYKKDLKKNILNALLYVFILVVIVMSFSYFKDIIFKTAFDTNNEFLYSSFAKNSIYFIFSTILIAPFIEEIVFRKAFKDVINNKIVFILISSLVFGFYHVGYFLSSSTDLIFIFKYFLVGCCFSYFYTKSDNFFTPYLTHLVYNIIMLIILVVL